MIENSSEIKHEKDQFNILLTGYEGPIDLLLDLAKKQKVDLSEISILALAEQYIEYINNYNKIHLEIAADYLVMSAWLTYLKSRLLLPKDEIEDEHTPEELEEALRFQLLRLEAIQNKLYENQMNRNKLLKNQTIEVLVENLTDDKTQTFGRSEYMTSVVFNGNKEHVGKIVPVKIKKFNRTTLFGEIIKDSDKKVA